MSSSRQPQLRLTQNGSGVGALDMLTVKCFTELYLLHSRIFFVRTPKCEARGWTADSIGIMIEIWPMTSVVGENFAVQVCVRRLGYRTGRIRIYPLGPARSRRGVGKVFKQRDNCGMESICDLDELSRRTRPGQGVVRPGIEAGCRRRYSARLHRCLPCDAMLDTFR